MQKQMKLVIVLVSFFILCFFNEAEAKTKTIYLEENKKYIIDLNGGGKETIQFVTRLDEKSWETYSILKIDGKQIYQKRSVVDFRLGDINRKDKYVEIFATGEIDPRFSEKLTTVVYRFNGQRLKKYSSWNEGFYYDRNTIKKLLGSKKQAGGLINANGNGTVTCRINVYSRKGVSSNAFLINDPDSNGFEVNAIFNVGRNKIKMQREKWFKCEKSRITSFYNMYAYTNSKMKDNKLIFTVEKGAKYIPIKIKFGAKYTCLQIKDVKSKKRGYVFVDSKYMYWWNWML